MTITIPMIRGPYQDNGASPWSGLAQVGSTGLTMKMALDTGTNLFWVTSTLCTTQACTMPGRVQFDPNTSSTFSWIDQTPTKINYGPWGSMMAEKGSDTISINNANPQGCEFYLATNYGGAKFEEVDWDGCIGFPSGTRQAGTEVTFYMQQLIDSGALGSSDLPWAAFDWDASTKQGSCELGDVDNSKFISSEGMYLPYDAYKLVPSVDYIWTSGPANVSVAGTEITDKAIFCPDTGSSRFKGDPNYIKALLAAISPNHDPVDIEVGMGFDGSTGALSVTSSMYMQTIEKGQNAGKTMPQFAPMDGVPNLLLVGSVLLDNVYSIYCYMRTPGTAQYGDSLEPMGVFLFNKPGGPKVVQNTVGKDIDADEMLRIATEEFDSRFAANKAIHEGAE